MGAAGGGQGVHQGHQTAAVGADAHPAVAAGLGVGDDLLNGGGEAVDALGHALAHGELGEVGVVEPLEVERVVLQLLVVLPLEGAEVRLPEAGDHRLLLVLGPEEGRRLLAAAQGAAVHVVHRRQAGGDGPGQVLPLGEDGDVSDADEAVLQVALGGGVADKDQFHCVTLL